jgi:hypothetical protein
VRTHGTYYREKGTGFFLRVSQDKVPNERIGFAQGAVYKARVYDEDRGRLEPEAFVSEEYLKNKCVYWKATFVPMSVRDMLNMGW